MNRWQSALSAVAVALGSLALMPPAHADVPAAAPDPPVAADTPEPEEPEPIAIPAEFGIGPGGRIVQSTATIGRSANGRKIKAWFVGEFNADHVLVVLGQMHGDELAGKATAMWIRNHVRPKKGTAMWVVPTMNPDGDARGTRVNGNGVDLNRNWPTSGWQATPRGSRYWSGPEPGSEPETRAMMAFLKKVKPDYIASIHQPLHGIGKSGEDVKWERRLARNLSLPRKYFGVSQGAGVSPTLTGWYNHRLGSHGTATTIEYGASPGQRYRTRIAGRGIARAAKVR